LDFRGAFSDTAFGRYRREWTKETHIPGEFNKKGEEGFSAFLTEILPAYF
jgi:hypothetical protein